MCSVLDAGQESLPLSTPHESESAVVQPVSHTSSSIAISVSTEHLKTVSSSILLAETWVRAHVLSHYPATKITTIVVGNGVVCNRTHEDKWGFVLPSVKNIYHSLIRWGLEKEIKVSVAFSQECVHPFCDIFKNDLAETLVRPLLGFLQFTHSPYSVNPPTGLSERETINMVFSHQDSIKHLGFSNLSVKILSSDKESIRRKLSFTTLEEPPSSPTYTLPFVPAYRNKDPPPPFDHETAPSPSFQFPAPRNRHHPRNRPPLQFPLFPPPNVPTLPPCNPKAGTAPTPETGEEKGLWCVAKPTVPEDTLQEAMDYACGEGGGDCEEISPSGRCYYPNTIVSHASYAFNSYWQMKKNAGGTCDFGGTAMIINSDPSNFIGSFVFVILLSFVVVICVIEMFGR